MPGTSPPTAPLDLQHAAADAATGRPRSPEAVAQLRVIATAVSARTALIRSATEPVPRVGWSADRDGLEITQKALALVPSLGTRAVVMPIPPDFGTSYERIAWIPLEDAGAGGAALVMAGSARLAATNLEMLRTLGRGVLAIHRVEERHVRAAMPEDAAPHGLWQTVRGAIRRTLHTPIAPYPPRSSPEPRPYTSASHAPEPVGTGLHATIVGSSPLAMIAVDPSGRVRLWNEAAQNLLGWGADEVTGQPLPLALGLTTGSGEARSREMVLTTRGGARVEALIWRQPLPPGAAAQGGSVYVIADISERISRARDREHLLESHARARRLSDTDRARAIFLEEAGSRLSTSFGTTGVMAQALADHLVPALGDWAVVLVPDGRREWSPAAARSVLPQATRSLQNRVPPAGAFSGIERRRGWLHPPAAGAATHSPIALHYHELDPDGTGSLSTLALPLMVAGRLVGVVVLGRTGASGRLHTYDDVELGAEVADRAAVHLENQRVLEEAHRTASLRQEVLSVVSHDLRSPLNVVELTLQTVLQHWPPRPEFVEPARSQMALAQRSAGRMKRLIRDLLDAAQIDAGTLSMQMEPVDLLDVLQEAYAAHRALAEDASVRLTFDPGEVTALPARIDAGRIHQVLTNLLGNALRHAPADGEVVLGLRREGINAVVSVEDSGPGISPDHLPFVFDRFWRAEGQSHGAGLGLAIARGIVAGHGGEIRVASEYGAGAVFRFTLPLREPATEP